MHLPVRSRKGTPTIANCHGRPKGHISLGRRVAGHAVLFAVATGRRVAIVPAVYWAPDTRRPTVSPVRGPGLRNTCSFASLTSRAVSVAGGSIATRANNWRRWFCIRRAGPRRVRRRHAATPMPTGFRGGDLHVLDELAIEERFEDGVAERRPQVLDRVLAQVVVDAIDLLWS